MDEETGERRVPRRVLSKSFSLDAPAPNSEQPPAKHAGRRPLRRQMSIPDSLLRKQAEDARLLVEEAERQESASERVEEHEEEEEGKEEEKGRRKPLRREKSVAMQGDLSFYEEEALERRAFLMEHPDMVASVSLMWEELELVVDSFSSSGECVLLEGPYNNLHRAMTKALVPGFHSDDELARLAKEDWKADTTRLGRTVTLLPEQQQQQEEEGAGGGGGAGNVPTNVEVPCLGKKGFCRSVMEMADLWTTTVDPTEYMGFLEVVADVVAEEALKKVSHWSAVRSQLGGTKKAGKAPFAALLNQSTTPSPQPEKASSGEQAAAGQQDGEQDGGVEARSTSPQISEAGAGRAAVAASPPPPSPPPPLQESPLSKVLPSTKAVSTIDFLVQSERKAATPCADDGDDAQGLQPAGVSEESANPKTSGGCVERPTGPLAVDTVAIAEVSRVAGGGGTGGVCLPGLGGEDSQGDGRPFHHHKPPDSADREEGAAEKELTRVGDDGAAGTQPASPGEQPPAAVANKKSVVVVVVVGGGGCGGEQTHPRGVYGPAVVTLAPRGRLRLKSACQKNKSSSASASSRPVSHTPLLSARTPSPPKKSRPPPPHQNMKTEPPTTANSNHSVASSGVHSSVHAFPAIDANLVSPWSSPPSTSPLSSPLSSPALSFVTFSTSPRQPSSPPTPLPARNDSFSTPPVKLSPLLHSLPATLISSLVSRRSFDEQGHDFSFNSYAETATTGCGGGCGGDGSGGNGHGGCSDPSGGWAFGATTLKPLQRHLVQNGQHQHYQQHERIASPMRGTHNRSAAGALAPPSMRRQPQAKKPDRATKSSGRSGHGDILDNAEFAALLRLAAGVAPDVTTSSDGVTAAAGMGWGGRSLLSSSLSSSSCAGGNRNLCTGDPRNSWGGDSKGGGNGSLVRGGGVGGGSGAKSGNKNSSQRPATLFSRLRGGASGGLAKKSGRGGGLRRLSESAHTPSPVFSGAERGNVPNTGAVARKRGVAFKGRLTRSSSEGSEAPALIASPWAAELHSLVQWEFFGSPAAPKEKESPHLEL